MAVEQVEADDAVGVDVRVVGYWVRCVADEGDFWWLFGGGSACGAVNEVMGIMGGRLVDTVEYMSYLDGVLSTEHKLQPVRLALVYRVRVDNLKIHKPSLEVVGVNECNSIRQLALHLRQHQ